MHLQPLSTQVCHGPISSNHSETWQWVSLWQQEISVVMSRSHLHCTYKTQTQHWSIQVAQIIGEQHAQRGTKEHFLCSCEAFDVHILMRLCQRGVQTVVLLSPVPSSMSTIESVMMGRSLSVKGCLHCFPWTAWNKIDKVNKMWAQRTQQMSYYIQLSFVSIIHIWSAFAWHVAGLGRITTLKISSAIPFIMW